MATFSLHLAGQRHPNPSPTAMGPSSASTLPRASKGVLAVPPFPAHDMMLNLAPHLGDGHLLNSVKVANVKKTQDFPDGYEG